MAKNTSLYEKHLAAGGKMVDFAGWEMPIHYGSQLEEHHQVRRDAGIFDVSHMTIIDLSGREVRGFLQKLLANDVNRLKKKGKALYSCMLNEKAGVIDDLIIYYMHDDWYRMIVNAATRNKDLTWIEKQAQNFEINIDERPDLAMLAVQGPNAREKAHKALGNKILAAQDLTPFFAVDCGEIFVGRTGYTGEDGYEIVLPSQQVPQLWDDLLTAGIEPIGLGARDTLRLEAGMNLYGQDMDESTNPLESGLAWTIAWQPEDRDFIGRGVLQKLRDSGPNNKLVGLVLQERGVLRNHQKVIVDGVGEGEITSGSFSPTLKCAIALARVPAQTEDQCHVEIRGEKRSAKVVKPSFVRFGQSCID
ncbi:MAG: glycine cleavage system aminomethyltransferase GcvT [Gammaproteobacteria bacterium]|nr:glycine cleavage system aminomethyltransferase GcvT [Gammaproteobacteria bacterium]